MEAIEPSSPPIWQKCAVSGVRGVTVGSYRDADIKGRLFPWTLFEATIPSLFHVNAGAGVGALFHVCIGGALMTMGRKTLSWPSIC